MDIQTAGDKCKLLPGLLYGGYANVVVFGDISGNDHWMGRAVVISWERYSDLLKKESWDFAQSRVASPTYIRGVLRQTDYRSAEEKTDVVRVLRPSGEWVKMTRDEACDLVLSNDWPTNANNQAKRYGKAEEKGPTVLLSALLSPGKPEPEPKADCSYCGNGATPSNHLPGQPLLCPKCKRSLCAEI